MVHIKIDDSDNTYKFPTSWYEVTVHQFLQLRKKDTRDFIELVSILSGISYEKLFVCQQTDLDEKLFPFMQWLHEPLTEKQLSRVKHISFGTKQYPVPDGKVPFTFGQKISLQNKLIESKEKEGSTLDCLAFAVAVYFQPIVTGEKFSTEAAEKFAVEQVLQCSITEAWGVADFFLKKSSASLHVTQNIFQPDQIKWNWLRRLTAWINSKSSLRLTHSQEAIHLNMNRY